jgi:indole-3-glycerol phosphate synthase
MNILDKIAAHKRQEVATRQELYPIKLLEKSLYFGTPTVSLSKYLRRPDLSGVIAEFKRQSPSKGLINAYAKVEEVSVGYMQAGASALSILTDTTFFGGTSAHLTTARRLNFCPILRKDFVLNEYQIIEAKSIGADAILLIAAILTPAETAQLAAFAHSLGIEVLLEVHTAEEIARSTLENIDAIGVNNRNLQDFTVSVHTSLELAALLPKEKVWVSESGISQIDTSVMLKKAGFSGLLIGEAFMKEPRPAKACLSFITGLQQALRASKTSHSSLSHA